MFSFYFERYVSNILMQYKDKILNVEKKVPILTRKANDTWVYQWVFISILRL